MLQELAEEQMQRAAAAKAAAAASPRDHVDVDHVRRELAQVQTTLHAAQKVRSCCGCYFTQKRGSHTGCPVFHAESAVTTYMSR